MIRTRFAPSPTGFLHIGGLRTALYSYIFAKQHDGQFILRVEDTDQKRFVEGATESLIKILKTLGLTYDEGPDIGGPYEPYLQSQRTVLYQKYADELLTKKYAYHCFCTAERLETMRHDQQQKKQAPMYDRHCLHLTDEQIKENLRKKIPFVIRQLIPNQKNITFTDLIRGPLSFDPGTIDDQVLIKSDGFPTYHLANVVDDHDMKISHVIRGEEWLPSTPKHILLYESFGWAKPQFAHLPLLLNPDKSKLSKRQGDVAVEDYLKKGYLKEVLINFVALLGWNPGEGSTQEIFNLAELIKQFSLAHVQKAGAVFNLEKLDWLNGKYIRDLSIDKLVELVLPHLEKEEWFTKSSKHNNTVYLEKCLTLEQARLKTLSEAPNLIKFFFLDKLEFDPILFINAKMKVDQQTAKTALEKSLEALKSHDNFDDEANLQACLTKIINELNCKNGQVLWPVRLALTGQPFSPGVFEVMRVLGKEETIKRIAKGIEILKKFE